MLSRTWDKEKIFSPHEESNLRPSHSVLRCSVTEPQKLYGKQGPLPSKTISYTLYHHYRSIMLVNLPIKIEPHTFLFPAAFTRHQWSEQGRCMIELKNIPSFISNPDDKSKLKPQRKFNHIRRILFTSSISCRARNKNQITFHREQSPFLLMFVNNTTARNDPETIGVTSIENIHGNTLPVHILTTPGTKSLKWRIESYYK